MLKRLLLVVRCAFPLVVASTARGVATDHHPSPRVAASRTRRAAILSVVPSGLLHAVALHCRTLPCWARQESLYHPFWYSDNWTGTALSVLSLEEAVQLACVGAITNDADTDSRHCASSWPMARWPDSILRRPASPVPQQYFGSTALDRACQLLQGTARKEKAVGLAAEQCGVDARIIYLDDRGASARSRQGTDSLVMVNPRIVERSPEAEMKVWNERCLVLPPSFAATVLRDAWVEVAYQDPPTGAWRSIRLAGEAARAFQHEYDHDRGILITDHVSFEEMDSDLMASIEADGHAERMHEAYERVVYLRRT